MSVRDNIQYPLRVRRLAAAEQSRRSSESRSFSASASPPEATRPALRGEQQRVASRARSSASRACSSWMSRCRTSTRSSGRTPDELKALRSSRRDDDLRHHDQAEAMTMGDRIASPRRRQASAARLTGTPCTSGRPISSSRSSLKPSDEHSSTLVATVKALGCSPEVASRGAAWVTEKGRHQGGSGRKRFSSSLCRRPGPRPPRSSCPNRSESEVIVNVNGDALAE